MGLDMYAFTTSENIAAVDFDDPEDAVQVCYWRKHPNLHGWMQKLYRAKGGKDDDFNLNPIRLDPADIDALEKGSWPETRFQEVAVVSRSNTFVALMGQSPTTSHAKFQLRPVSRALMQNSDIQRRSFAI